MGSRRKWSLSNKHVTGCDGTIFYTENHPLETYKPEQWTSYDLGDSPSGMTLHMIFFAMNMYFPGVVVEKHQHAPSYTLQCLSDRTFSSPRGTPAGSVRVLLPNRSGGCWSTDRPGGESSREWRHAIDAQHFVLHHIASIEWYIPHEYWISPLLCGKAVPKNQKTRCFFFIRNYKISIYGSIPLELLSHPIQFDPPKRETSPWPQAIPTIPRKPSCATTREPPSRQRKTNASTACGKFSIQSIQRLDASENGWNIMGTLW